MSEHAIYLEDINIPFTIDNDAKAEWALRKIAKIEKDAQKWETFYAAQTDKVWQQAEADKAYFMGLLESYFATVPHKTTKTQESYTLPGGKLIRKAQQPAYTRDDAQLLPWAKENALYKVVESPDWVNIKKRVTVNGTTAVDTETGEIIPGITVEQRPPVFQVSLKEE